MRSGSSVAHQRSGCRMASQAELLEIANFIRLHQNAVLFSTRALVVNVFDEVYNVKGSTRDPKIGSKSWKQLLIYHGINDDCYVTNQSPPSKSSHADFSVGGHVTINSDGTVEAGEDSYLMPLCSWHNSTHRDGKAFSHTKTQMLRLEGFMEGDTVTTFMARSSDIADTASRIIFETDEGWDVAGIEDGDPILEDKNKAPAILNKGASLPYFVITRKEDGNFRLEKTSDHFGDIPG